MLTGGILLTACQVRMARAALRWPVEELARRSGVSQASIRRIESVYGVPNVTVSILEKLRAAFEEAGIVFLADDGARDGGPGLRFSRYPGRQAAAA
ncbi:MAG TPA: helix-turn-helix transcriptional regulator [Roseomonas sp.]|nr:helix-turn-helix transcriptional regulator [Roseomonas sp.]